MRPGILAVAVVALLLPVPLAAQGFGVAARASTTGVGGDVAVSLLPRVNLRAGVGVFPIEPTGTFSDVDYTISFPSPQLLGTLDLFPFGDTFRLSGGVLAKSEDVEIRGELSGDTEIGGRTYTPSQVGTLRGSVITEDVAPYVGFGFGNHASPGVGLVLDFGVAFQGEPRVSLRSVGGELSDDPTFRSELDREARQAEDDLGTFYKAYPVISFGFRFGLGG